VNLISPPLPVNLIFQGVTFFGLLLCCTHLSEITLTIAANILHTFFAFKGKFYWWVFTDKQLNTDFSLLKYFEYHHPISLLNKIKTYLHIPLSLKNLKYCCL